jgi:hypothetical protein
VGIENELVRAMVCAKLRTFGFLVVCLLGVCHPVRVGQCF